MALKIEFSGNTVKDEGRALNRLHFSGSEDVEIAVRDNEIAGKAAVMEDISISEREVLEAELEKLSSQAARNSVAYQKLEEILADLKSEKRSWKDTVKKFASDLTTGTISSLLSGQVLEIIKHILR